MKRFTIKDIAKALDITPSTVSRALKDHPDVSEKTRQRVKEVAAELNYRPNTLAINFRKRNSGLIALVLPDLNTFFFPSVIKAIQEATKAAGYHLIILQSDNTLQSEKQSIDFCQQVAVDGLILCISQETSNLKHLSSLFRQNIPIVFIDEVIKADHCITVGLDDFQAGYKVGHYLLQKGHERIAVILGNAQLNLTQERLQGCRSAFREANQNIESSLIANANTPREASEVFHDLWKNTAKKPTAVFVMTDELLVGVMPVVQELGIIVPDQLAMICISDGEAPSYFHPPITHLLHDGTLVGETAIQTLFELLQGERKQIQQAFYVDAKLIEMGST